MKTKALLFHAMISAVAVATMTMSCAKQRAADVPTRPKGKIRCQACLPTNMQIQVKAKKEKHSPKMDDVVAVRNAINSLIDQVKIRVFVLQEAATDGSFKACMVPAGSDGYLAMSSVMSAVKVDAEETLFTTTLVDVCDEPKTQ